LENLMASELEKAARAHKPAEVRQAEALDVALRLMPVKADDVCGDILASLRRSLSRERRDGIGYSLLRVLNGRAKFFIHRFSPVVRRRLPR
jgi:hypothetical protein